MVDQAVPPPPSAREQPRPHPEPPVDLGAGMLQHHSASHYRERPAGGSSLDQTVALLAAGFGFPTVQVNILDRTEQHTVAVHGGSLERRPRSAALCDQVVSSGETLVLEDIDPAHPVAAGVRSYVGVPLRGREGLTIGSLCLLDVRPRTFGAERTAQLEAVAVIVQDQLEVVRRRGDAAPDAVLATELVRAVHDGQIVPHFQPVVDLPTGRVTGWEALVRWDHPERGLLPPGVFLPLAEDTEIIVDLDLAVLAQACAVLAGRLRSDAGLRLAVNLSPRHVRHPTCVQRLHSTVVAAGVSPRSVVFELTETAVLAAEQADQDFLLRLRSHGFTVLLDDFGTGFSAVEHLLRLPVDGFKVDRSVTALLHTRSGAVVAQALAFIADGLGLEVVIEGIETAEQAATALSLGYTRGQGHLWSAPVPADQLD